MTTFTAPADLLHELLQPWLGGRAFLTPEVWIEGHARTDATFYLTRIASTAPGRGYGSIALDKLCQLADYANCSLVVPAASLPKSSDAGLSQDQLYHWLGKHGFVSRGKVGASALVRRPQNQPQAGKSC